jgi:hypothetical protein
MKYYPNYINNIQSALGGTVSIMGGHSVGHSKQKCVLTRTVSEIELFHSTDE